MNIFINEYKTHQDTGDKWGSCLAWAFALCDWLTDNSSGPECAWEFEQSCAGSDTDSHEYQLISELYNDDNWDQLEHFEKVLLRYKNWLELTEHDY